MLEHLGDNRGNCYTSIVIHITEVPLAILDDGYDSTQTELIRNKGMAQHAIKKRLQPVKQTERSVEEFLCSDLVIIAGFALFHAEYCIHYSFQ